MKIETLQVTQSDNNPFGLRGLDFSMRIPEKFEIFTDTEAQTYITSCDYPESVDDLLLALEMQGLFGPERIRSMSVLDVMCGPGRLGRELLGLGVQRVVFHDGDETMIAHARNQALMIMQDGQSIDTVTSDVVDIPHPDNEFDLIICHNSTHQLSSIHRLDQVMQEFLRLTVPGGHIVIADYQRAATPEFFNALEERLQWTRPEIVPLLIPSFMATFSKQEFADVLASIPGIRKWSVTDAQPPVLTAQMQEVVDKDPVKGHLIDYGPISLRAIVQKAKI